MLKKIMLGIVATVMLIGGENLISQETQDRPKEEAKQEQPQEGRQRQKGRARQPRRQRADREAVREGTENLRGEPEPVRPGQEKLAQPRQMFGRYLDELTKAYRANDREKMGQLLRKMHQLRQKWQRVRGLGFQGRGMFGGWGRGWQGRGIGGWGQGFQGRGMMGEWGRGFQGRGFDRQGPDMPQPPFMERPEPDEKDMDRPGPPKPPRDMGGWGQGFQGRGMMGGWGRGFQGRGFDRQGPSMPQPPFMERPEPDEKDMDRPGPPKPPRDMGGWGRSPSEQ